MDPHLDTLTAQLHEWTEAALALDETHFPREMLNELEDLVSELKAFLDEEPDLDRRTVTDPFINPEMAEVVERFPRVRRLLESAWGSDFVELLKEEADGFTAADDDSE